jgi:hypothetical protein
MGLTERLKKVKSGEQHIKKPRQKKRGSHEKNGKIAFGQ